MTVSAILDPKVHVGHALERLGYGGTQPIDRRCGIDEAIDERTHLLGRNAGEVVSHRHVEDMASRIGANVLAERLPLAKQVDRHPALDILFERGRHLSSWLHSML